MKFDFIETPSHSKGSEEDEEEEGGGDWAAAGVWLWRMALPMVSARGTMHVE